MKTSLTVLWLLGASAAGLGLSVPARAECDAPPPVSGTASERLDLALDAMKNGRHGYAYRVARSIYSMDEASDAQRAKAHVIAAYVNWHNGLLDEARSQMKDAKKLDA